VLRTAVVGIAEQPGRRPHRLIRDAFRLEWLTIGWMSIEAVVALISGAAAGSLVLIASLACRLWR
jgi:hypothetical protein